jgi:hypothetical protein
VEPVVRFGPELDRFRRDADGAPVGWARDRLVPGFGLELVEPGPQGGEILDRFALA